MGLHMSDTRKSILEQVIAGLIVLAIPTGFTFINNLRTQIASLEDRLTKLEAIKPEPIKPEPIRITSKACDTLAENYGLIARSTSFALGASGDSRLEALSSQMEKLGCNPVTR